MTKRRKTLRKITRLRKANREARNMAIDASGVPSLRNDLAARMGEDRNLTEADILEADRTIKEAMAAIQKRRWDELAGGVSVQQDDPEDDED